MYPYKTTKRYSSAINNNSKSRSTTNKKSTLRKQKINQLKESINSGNYKVTNDILAMAILKERFNATE